MKRIIAGIKAKVRAPVREAMHHVRLRIRLRRIERQEPILVYQMGKVGSSTVVKTLKKLRLRNPVLHVHTLNDEVLASAIRKERATPSPYLPEHLITSSLLVRKLRKGIFPCTVITLTREPIGRAISFAFEDWQKKAGGARRADGTLDETLMQDAVTEMLSGDNGHADPSVWFDQEIRSVFGVDVFSVPYDVEQGYVVLERGPVSLFVIRMEDVDRALPEALQAGLGIRSAGVVVERANEGGASWYAQTHRRVKEVLRLPSDVIEPVLDTRYVQHFYARERDALRRRWQS